MTDPRQQRINMVESQVRPSDVTDRRILRAMLEVPREVFVPGPIRSLAYMDEAVPLAGSANGGAMRYLMAPRTLAKLIQLAQIEPDATVLDVGCASGYSTAVLAKLAGKVVAVEADATLAAQASRTLREMGIANATVVQAPLNAGAPAQAPFGAILINGAVPEVPRALLDQLEDGGRLVGVICSGPVRRAQVWQRIGKTYDAQPAFDASAEPLPGFEAPAVFTF